MLEWLSDITCIGEACKTNSYWLGTVLGQIFFIGVIPLSIYIIYRKFFKKKKVSKNDGTGGT